MTTNKTSDTKKNTEKINGDGQDNPGLGTEDNPNNPLNNSVNRVLAAFSELLYKILKSNIYQGNTARLMQEINKNPYEAAAHQLALPVDTDRAVKLWELA
jgi:hydrogenase maturation factor HypF (carbamoyltransferase family)